jgi:hypothetical protein
VRGRPQCERPLTQMAGVGLLRARPSAAGPRVRIHDGSSAGNFCPMPARGVRGSGQMTREQVRVARMPLTGSHVQRSAAEGRGNDGRGNDLQFRNPPRGHLHHVNVHPEDARGLGRAAARPPDLSATGATGPRARRSRTTGGTPRPHKGDHWSVSFTPWRGLGDCNYGTEALGDSLECEPAFWWPAKRGLEKAIRVTTGSIHRPGPSRDRAVGLRR